MLVLPPAARPAEHLYPAVAAALARGGSFVQVSYDVRNAAEGAAGPRNPDILVDPPVVAAELGSLGLTVTRARHGPPPGPDRRRRGGGRIDAVVHAVKP